MASYGEKVADGYILLHTDDSVLRVEVKTKAAKAAKDFGDTLNTRLKALGIREIDLKANPHDALVDIERVRAELIDLSKEAATVEVKIDYERALGDLDRFRKSVGDNFKVIGSEAGQKMGRQMAGDFIDRFGQSLGQLGRSGITAPMVQVLASAAVIAAPTMAGVMASAVVGGIGIGGIVGGVALAAKDPEMATAIDDIKKRFTEGLQADALTAFRKPMLDALYDVDQAAIRSRGQVAKIFANTAPQTQEFTRSVIRAGESILDSFVYASERSAGPMRSLGLLVETVAHSTGNLIDMLADHSDTAESSMQDLAGTIQFTIETVKGLLFVLLTLKDGFDKIDNAIDHSRAWLENLIGGLDLTADGYKAGSEAAQLYRDGVIGAAGSANDYAHYVKEAGRATGTFNTQLLTTKITADDVKAAEQQLKGSQDALTRSLDELGGKTSRQTQLSNHLKTAMDNLYGAAIRQTDANETYEESWDNLSQAILDNGRSLDIHTKAGRTNRDALEGLLQTTGDAYLADIEAGVAIDQATKKHNNRIAAIKEESKRLGLNEKETQDLINTYGKIPPKKITQLIQEGLDQIIIELKRLYLAQRALAEGKTINQVRYEGTAAMRSILAEGGPVIGDGPRGVDSVPILAAPGEYMHRTAAVDYYGVAAMEAINQKRVPRTAIQGYAAGGLVAPVDRARWWPMVVNMGVTKVMTMEEALSRVTPAFGAWPSSPSAQRGDSGVWRRIEQMVRRAGFSAPLVSGYRGGDPLWHGSGRADDFGGFNLDSLARFFLQRQSLILEMIHRSATRDYAYTRGRNKGSFNESLMQAHRNHLHIAMDDTGQLLPGWNSIYNGTGRPETATPAPMMDAVVQRLDRLIGTREMGLPRGDIRDLADQIGAAVAGVLAGTMPQARTAARQIGKRPR